MGELFSIDESTFTYLWQKVDRDAGDVSTRKVAHLRARPVFTQVVALRNVEIVLGTHLNDELRVKRARVLAEIG